MPRIAVVVAHPDDESLAIGARMSRYRDAHFIHITDGAPRNGEDAARNGFASVEAYAGARALELRDALRTGGINHPNLHSLNIPDQEASLNLVPIAERLAVLFAALRPEAILTHPYEGGHPDHDACAFAVHHAVALNHLDSPPPVILEAAFYHTGLNGGMETGYFLPGNAAPTAQELTRTLNPEESARKRAVLGCFTTQRATLKAFSVEQEIFRLAPQYDFTKPPHSRPFLYDQFGWGVNSRRFLELTAAAATELAPEAPLCR